MSYDDEVKKASKQPAWVVELDLDYCSNEFGVLPCTAIVSEFLSSDDKCRNTYATCQDRPNYVNETKTYRFCSQNADIPPDAQALPFIRSVRQQPLRRQPTRGLPARGGVKITFVDHPWHDRDVDKYALQRSWNYEDRGTFFGRFLATNEFTEGRVVRVYFGFVADPWTLDNFKARTYLIHKFEGPNSDGIVTLDCVEPLAPLSSQYFPLPTDSALSSNINASSGNIGVTNTDPFSASDYVVVNEEIFQVGSVNTGQSRLDGCTRGVLGTTASAHSAEDGLQKCGWYPTQNCVDIAYNLIVVQGGRDPSLINLTQWNAEKATWFGGFDISRVIPEPTPVNDLLSDLCEQCGMDIYWDDLGAQYILKAVKPAQGPGLLSDDNFLYRSVSVTRQNKDRVSLYNFYYGKTNILERDEPRYYREQAIFAGGTGPSQHKEERVREIFANWIPADADLVVNTVGGRYITRKKSIPVHVKFSLDYSDVDIWMGSDFIFDSKLYQGPTGLNSRINCEVIEVNPRDNLVEFIGEFTGLSSTRNFIIGANLAITYDTATDQQRIDNGFISENDGLMSDQSQGYAIQ